MKAATIAIAALIVTHWKQVKEFLEKACDAIVDAGKCAWDHLAIFIIGPMKLVIDWLIDVYRDWHVCPAGLASRLRKSGTGTAIDPPQSR